MDQKDASSSNNIRSKGEHKSCLWIHKRFSSYGSVSPGREFGPFCVIFLKKVQAYRLWPVPDPAETPQALSAVRIKAYQNQLILSRQADTFLVDTAILGLVAVFLLTGSWLSLDWSGSFWASCRADVCFLADIWLLSRLLACYQLLTSCKAALSRQR